MRRNAGMGASSGRDVERGTAIKGKGTAYVF